MPSSLSLTTPPSTASKRQRSQESRDRQAGPPSAGQDVADTRHDDSQRLARTGIRMPSYLSKTKAEITANFLELEWSQRHRLAQALTNAPHSPFRIDRSAVVLSRNRYMNVQPWDASRIKLKAPLDGSDYVNASPINLKYRGPPAKVRSRANSSQKNGVDPQVDTTINKTSYIATQGPKDGQSGLFWHMVMQETAGDVGVIVMLTPCYEGVKEKCAQYFPGSLEQSVMPIPAMKIGDGSLKNDIGDDGDPFLDSDSSSADTDSGDTDTNPESEGTLDFNDKLKTESGSVELLSLESDNSIGCEVRKLKLSIGDTSKTIYHYLYNDWADFGKPEVEDRLALLQLTRISKEVAGDSPRIIHCSAGVGRTGTWIALDFLLRELEEGRLVGTSQPTPAEDAQESTRVGTWGKSGPAKASTPEAKGDHDRIFETVNNLREQRMMMVMNEVQLGFLYEALREAFLDRYLEKETGPTVLGEPAAKAARTSDAFDDRSTATGVGRQSVSEEDTVSEAETEIMEQDKRKILGLVDLEDGAADPYAAVSPESIRRGIETHEKGFE